MARSSNPELLKRYRMKLSQCKRMRKQEQCDDTWKRMLDLYRGRHYENYSDEDRLLVNMAFSTINVIAPSVSINHPKITVSARRPEDADKATVTEAIVNYWWRHYGCQPQFRSAVKDFLIFGHGWVKVGYRFVEEERVKNADPNVEENDVVDLVPESNMETELIILEDRPFIERISPFDMFVDPDATSMYDVRWIAQRIKRPLMDVKNDRRYNSTARSEAQPTLYSKYSEDTQIKQPYGEERDSYVEVWEWYDITKKTMAVFCDGPDKFLIAPTKIPFSFGHPFTMLRNYEVPEHFYPMGELEAIESLQHELNATRTQMMNHRKRFSRKWLYKESAFDPDGRSALESDEDNIMVPVSGDEPLSGVIVPMPAVISPPEFYNQSNLISSDMDRVSGISDYMRGAMPEIRRTATEAGIAADASNARASDKLAAIELYIGAAAQRLVALAQQYMTGEQVARVVGSNAIPLWVTFDSDYIKGEFDYEVEGGSTAPVNESFRRQMALQMVDAMAPFVGAGVVDMAALARHVLQFGFGIKSPEAFLAGPPPQQEMSPEQGGMPPDQGGMPPQGMPQMPPQIPQEQPMAEQGGMPPELAAILGGAGAMQ